MPSVKRVLPVHARASAIPRISRRAILATSLAAGLIAGLGAAPVMAADVSLLNVSYDPTRELYKDISTAFAADWKAKTGGTVTVKSSHGGSGAQARAVIDGLQADIVTLGLAGDIQAIVDKSHKITPDWVSKFPNHATPFNSTIILIVRKGNPKDIHDWDDLAKPGIAVVTPNPKTSGGARWNYLAATAYAQKTFNNDDAKVRAFIGAIYKNAPVLDTGARGATTSFAQRGIGDVLIAWENEAYLVMDEFGADQFEIVTPSVSILAETPVAVVDAVVDQRGTRKEAEAYLNFLYSDAAQQIAAKHHYRPTRPEVVDKKVLESFPKLALVSIEAFGGWGKAQPTYFGDGGVFDQIYQPK